MIREVRVEDYDQIMQLYTHLHDRGVPNTYSEAGEREKALWLRIVSDPDYHILVAEEDGKIVSSCTCIVLPNLTRGQRPYAFVENVVTHSDHRGRGLASACLAKAREIAREAGCYKMMLLTGAKEESTLRFYEAAGYNRKDKTAFIQWL